MKPTVVDLFCGAGGFSKGFEKVGFKILLGVDNWKAALKTFKQNHKDVEVVFSDIRDIPNEFFEKYKGKVDVIIAGPPCQGFSMSGKRDPSDERNTLFEEVIRVSSIIMPKIIVMENVVGLLSMKTPDGHMIRDIILKRFKDIGYETESRILNAVDYGVPQTRKRVIFIASRIGKIGFPEPTHSEKPYISLNEKHIKEWVTVGDALGNIPDVGAEEYLLAKTEFQKLMSNGVIKIYNHEPIKHSPVVIKRMSFVPPGGNWRNIPKEYYNVGGKHSNNYRRLDSNKPSITIKHVTKSMIIHPIYNRCITVREAARLQSFCDSFIFYGTKFEQYQQVANAVPPLLGFAIANHILNVIKKRSSQQKSGLQKMLNELIKDMKEKKHD